MDEGLTEAERSANHATWRHIHRVQQLVLAAAKRLLDRALAHDQSKLVPPEVGPFAALTAKLAGCTYGSAEYQESRRQLGPALAHHYANNPHHPEHWKNGVDDMSLLDLLEMLLDWKASSERHTDGNIRKSIEVNAERFGLSPQLRRILENTAAVMADE